ncbi:MAG: hypothetical protein NTZ78_09205 [Candidatus Aureabacteria bacterium]|nr:hypothetical protein [Candidatus Auribacterota bacterium]
MKKSIIAALCLLFAICVSYTAVAGSLDSPGVPSAGSGMYTLQNLYDYLTSGTALTVQTAFQEPPSAPGSTMKTTKEIGDAIKALHDLCNVTADNVELGKTFFCTQPGSWGVQTGTLVVPPTPTPTLTPTITATPFVLNPGTCNATALPGWSWLNGACWSQAIADSVSWNKGVGDDTSNTGTYTCNSVGTLKSRMEAAVAGRWSEIVTSVDVHTFTTADNDVNGKPYISALAIADCVDGTRDIGPAITGSPDDWQGRSNVLYVWARAAGHSALPAVKYDGTSNEYEAACLEAGGGIWSNNTSLLSPDDNYAAAAVIGYTTGEHYLDYTRMVGRYACADQTVGETSGAYSNRTFRVVVRPAD